MAPLLPRRRLAPLACLAAVIAAAACSSGNAAKQSSAATGSGASAGTGGTTSSSSAAAGGGGTGGSSGPTALSLPQFVRGAAYADTSIFPKIPVVIAASGGTPDSVDVTLDNGTPTAATKGSSGYVAMVDINPLDPGAHMLVAQAKSGGAVTGTVKGSLTLGSGSLQFTQVATAGLAYDGHLVHDVAGDALDYTWVSSPTGTHQLFLAQLDGAFARLTPSDVVLNDPADEPLSGYTAFGPTGIGVVYRTAKPNDSHWLVKMRVVDPTGQNVLVPTIDLTQGEAAFSMAQAGVDPGGFSAAWLHITPGTDPNNPPPVEIRFSRWDVAANKLVGPITLDSDQPQPASSTQGPQILEPLAEMSIACNTSVCLVAYVRDVYNTLVEINEQKVFLAAVDLAGGALMGTPQPVEATDWDPQFWGNHLAVLADGSFVLVYQALDTAAAENPITPCDSSIERDLIIAVKIDATGKLEGTPKRIFDFQGSREYPRIAPLPEGFALFWEDQRDECSDSDPHIAMAANTVSADLSMLEDPYLEMPASIALPPEDPTLAATGSSFAVAWSDNRHGDGITDLALELYLDTYWHP